MLKIDTAKILQAEMDRKAFLKNAGIAFVSVIGLTTLVKNINGITAGQGSTKSNGASPYGYGGSAYGGRQVSR